MLGSTFGAPGIGVDVTAFGLLLVCFGVPEVLAFGVAAFGLLFACFGVPEVLGFVVPLSNAKRASGESHREADLPLLEFDCRL